MISAVTFFAALCFFLTGTLRTESPQPTLGIQWYDFSCIGEDRALLTTGLWLNYTSNSTDETGADEQSYSSGVWVDYKSPLPKLQYYVGNSSRIITSVTYIIDQPEHGGGSCHCFNITQGSDTSILKRYIIG